MDYKNMTDLELAEIMVEYINRTAILKERITQYLKGTDRGIAQAQEIKSEYIQLKTELSEIEHYVSLKRNRTGSDLYEDFSACIEDAIIHGFQALSNSQVNQRMYSAVSDGLYGLTKSCPKEKWNSIITENK